MIPLEKIGVTIQKLSNSEGFLARYEKMKMEILQNEEVRLFLKKHSSQITSEILDRSLTKLYEYITQSKNCSQCNSLGECQNIIQGYEPKLVFLNNRIDIQYSPCAKKIAEDEKNKASKRITCLHISKEMMEASLSECILDSPSRIKAVQKIEDFLESYEPGKKIKGLYFHGPFGTGKSYLLGAIAHELSERNISSLIVYVPEFLREMKQAIGDHSLNEKLDALKNAEILMLDDIGAESVSSWSRDEVLGPILQYRMNEHLPTFFSSNFDLEELFDHLTYSQRGEEEKIKAGRIIERIKYLAEPVLVDGKNKRHQSF